MPIEGTEDVHTFEGFDVLNHGKQNTKLIKHIIAQFDSFSLYVSPREQKCLC